MTNEKESIDPAGRAVAVAIFFALVVDGLNIQTLALALPSMSAEMKISGVMAGALGTYTLLGMGIGGIIAGWLADRIGRVRVTWWAVLVFSICTTVIAGCQQYWQVAVMRFVSGLGIAALYCVGTLLAAEHVPTRLRTTVLGTLQAGWSVGYVIAAILAAYVVPAFGWRPLFFSALLPGVACLLLLQRVSDPPSWIAAKEKATGPTPNEFRAIWSNTESRRTFVLWSLACIALQFGYFGANTWLPSYLVTDLGLDRKSMGWYVAGTYSMMVLGKVLTGYLGDVFGRRISWTVAGLATAAFLPFLVRAATPANVGYLLLVFGFLYGAPNAINATYMAESFPVSIRGTAVSTSYNIGRIGATLSPLMIGSAAAHYSIGAGLAVLGVSYVFCALIPGLFIREKMYDTKVVDGGVKAVERAATC